MFAILDQNYKVVGYSTIDVNKIGVELPADLDIYNTYEEALFFESGKFVLKNIYTTGEHKGRLKAQIYNDCKFEMETKNTGLNSSFVGAKIDCREIDILRIDQLINLTEDEGGTADTLLDYICYDNTTKKVKLSDVKKVKNELVKNIMSMLYYKHTLYAQIEQAMTKSELDLIVWDFKPIN